MKSDSFTRTTLAVIALALAVIAGQGAFNRFTTVHATSGTGPTYEYKFIIRTFSPDWQTGYAGANAKWTEDGKEPPERINNDGGMGSQIQFLGSKGWELVTDVTFSQHMTVIPQKSMAANGVVTREQLIFKRRKG